MQKGSTGVFIILGVLSISAVMVVAYYLVTINSSRTSQPNIVNLQYTNPSEAPLIQSSSHPKSRILNLPDQTEFRLEESNRLIINWLANRWSTSEDNIYIMVQDSEPWMKIVGVLDLDSLSSARVWILDSTHEEGKNWESYLMAQNKIHRGNTYIFKEYKPRSEIERTVAEQFYKRKISGLSVTGIIQGFAIIEDIEWSDM